MTLTARDKLQHALHRLDFAREDADAPRHEAALRALRQGLPPLPADGEEVASEALRDALGARANAFSAALAAYHREQRERLAARNLETADSYAVMFAHTRLMDALLRCAFEVAVAELPVLVRLQMREHRRELAFKEQLLARKRHSLEQLRAELPHVGEDAVSDPREAHYARQVEQTLAAEVERVEAELAGLRQRLPHLERVRTSRETVLAHFVLFARGGYGRAELSFASDLDTGYCVDTRGLPDGQPAVYQELILRMERLLHDAHLRPAHQYFELGEDLSRFARPDALHTISAILESRGIVGGPPVLDALKQAFREVLPFARFLGHKLGEYHGQPAPSLTEMSLKDDRGGVRSVQIPLWLYGVITGRTGFMTGELLAAAVEDGLLSPWEAMRLLRALELLYELRNFLGLAESHYYSEEAAHSLPPIAAIRPDRLDDQVARLYLFCTRRFGSVDRFDSYRLRLVTDVQRITAQMLERLLDRMTRNDVDGLRLTVHLGRKEIVRIERADGHAAQIPALFPDSLALLRLLAYVAETDYELSWPLREALGEVVSTLALPDRPEGLREQAALLSRLMGGPHVHQAVADLFAISDPFADDLRTLMSRFLPEYGEAVFLLRRLDGHRVPLHRLLADALEQGQQALDWLHRKYPDFYHMLTPADVLAVKWGLLLHGLARLHDQGDDRADVADAASSILQRLGYADESLERTVHLLVQHHDSVAALSQSATYMDQALVQYLEIAGQETRPVILLFLVNVAILAAMGDEKAGELTALYRFFEEVSKVLSELRGIPAGDRSLQLVNVYFDQRKADLRLETRAHLLLNKTFSVGLHAALLEPLRTISPAESERLQARREELERAHREVVLGDRPGEESERRIARLVQLLQHELGEGTIRALTRAEGTAFDWFFAAFPNRYLLSMPPRVLATQVTRFSSYRSTRVLVDVVPGSRGRVEGLLVYANTLPEAHTRVSYALSRLRVNILSGKVNRVEEDDAFGYAYFFQISPVQAASGAMARELEVLIEHTAPPGLPAPSGEVRYGHRGTRVDFIGADEKAYVIRRDAEGNYARQQADYRTVRLTLRDEPFLFYKVMRAFDRFGVTAQQALVTTTGTQVVDYFYLLPADYERLRRTNFDEELVATVHMDVLEDAR